MTAPHVVRRDAARRSTPTHTDCSTMKSVQSPGSARGRRSLIHTDILINTQSAEQPGHIERAQCLCSCATSHRLHVSENAPDRPSILLQLQLRFMIIYLTVGIYQHGSARQSDSVMLHESK